MGLLSDFMSSSIRKKLTVGLTGTLLCAYLVVHVGGNLLLFKDDGGAAFDTYAETLPSFFLVRVIEVGLFAVFLLHIITGTIFWLRNRQARPEGYAVNRKNANSDPFSRMMFLTGSVVFIFLVIHLRTFWVPARFAHEQNPSMYALVTSAFSSPAYSLFYVAAMVLLAFHLRHGFQSALQTFGLRHSRYAAAIEVAGAMFWLAIPVAFAAMPLYFLLKA